MTDKEKRALRAGHSTGLLHAYYVIEAVMPEACVEIAKSYSAYCRLWCIYDHIRGEDNDHGKTEQVGPH